MSYLERALGFGTTTDAASVADSLLSDLADDTDASAIVGKVEQRTDDTDGVSVDEVVARMRDESNPVDAEFRADILTNLFQTVDEYAANPTRNELAGELIGFLETAETEGLLTENGFENATSAAEAGDIERLQDIVASDPKLQTAVTNDAVAERLLSKLDVDADTIDEAATLLSEPDTDDADTETNTDTMADDTDDKQDEGDGQMNAVALMEQLDAFDSDDVAAVERTAELTGQSVEEVAGDIVGDMLDLPGAGGSDNAEPDMNADDYDDKDGEDTEEDRMGDTEGDGTTDAKTEGVVTEDELDSKLESFEDRLLDSVTDAVTSDETVTQIGQKLGESDEAREALADNLMEDVDEKLESDGYVTPSPTQTADESSGKAADLLMGGGDD